MDYSLHTVASGPAKVGDKLVTTMFESLTPGFAAAFADRKADRPFVGELFARGQEPGMGLILVSGSACARRPDAKSRTRRRQHLGRRC